VSSPDSQQPEQPASDIPAQQLSAFVEGLYSSNLRFGIWCYLIDGSEPVHGFIDDPRSTLTHNMVEYHGVLELFRSLPEESVLTLSSDSKIVMLQLSGRKKVHSQNLADIISACQSVIRRKHIVVTYELIPKSSNLAGLQLDKNRVEWSAEHDFDIPVVIPATGRKPASSKAILPDKGAV